MCHCASRKHNKEAQSVAVLCFFHFKLSDSLFKLLLQSGHSSFKVGSLIFSRALLQSVLPRYSKVNWLWNLELLGIPKPVYFWKSERSWLRESLRQGSGCPLWGICDHFEGAMTSLKGLSDKQPPNTQTIQCGSGYTWKSKCDTFWDKLNCLLVKRKEALQKHF